MKNLTKIILSIIALSISNTLSANKYIVPNDFKSIKAAIEKAESDDTVFVKSGTYTESITLKDDITLIGESKINTIIKGNTKKPVIKGANGTSVSNFTIENGSKGIICENISMIIENNIIRDNKETGIHCLLSLPAIRNNIVYRNGESGVFCESVRSIKTSIEHNIIAENQYSGIMLAGRSEVLVQHNILFTNKQYGIWVGEESKKSRIIFNNFYNNRTSHSFYAQVDRTNLSEDPGFTQEKITGVYSYLTTSSNAMQGKGQGGATIGVIDQELLSAHVNDPDGDKVIGESDQCSGIAEDLDGFEDQDGCPDFDNDKDGIYDTQDKCPSEAEDFDKYMDEDGCPDLDNDKDGIADINDTCPMNGEVVNGYKDDDGCPDEVPQQPSNGKKTK